MRVFFFKLSLSLLILVSILSFQYIKWCCMVLLALTGKVICGMYLWLKRIVVRGYLEVLTIVKRKRGHFISYRHNSTSIYIYMNTIMAMTMKIKRQWIFYSLLVGHVQGHTPYHTIPNESNGKIEPAGTSKRFNFNSNRVSFLCFATSYLPQLLHLLYLYCCTT